MHAQHMLAGYTAFIRLFVWKTAIYEEKTVTVPCIAPSLCNCVFPLAGWFNKMNVKLLAKMTAQLLWVVLCLFQITSGISYPFLLTILSVLVFHIFMITRCGSLWLMLGVAIADDDFQVAVLIELR